MKRIMIIEIENCLQCNLLKTKDNYASYYYECSYNREYSSIVDDPDSHKVVEKELDHWFITCLKWSISPNE